MSLVAEYRKLKPQPKSGWEWNDSEDLNLKITKLITDDIDFGTHTSTEKQKKSFYSQIARKIGELVIDTPCPALAKSWMADGMPLWAIKSYTMSLTDGVNSYRIGNSDFIKIARNQVGISLPSTSVTIPKN